MDKFQPEGEPIALRKIALVHNRNKYSILGICVTHWRLIQQRMYFYICFDHSFGK